jgi:catechol 2,3-dioxygenase-like lactoylglutathione lyase family enzyme
MKIQELSPILWTKSIAETVAFYEGVLGFSSQSNFPNFVSLAKDDARIMFVVPQDEPDLRTVLTGSIYMFMEDVDGLWEQVKDKTNIKSPIADRDYLMRDFSILDNNGYELVFGQDISKK